MVKRIITHLITVVFTTVNLIRICTSSHDVLFNLWALTPIISNIVIIYFLTITLFKKPSDSDERFSSFIIGVISSNLPFVVAVIGLKYSLGQVNYSLISLGITLQMLAYPFYIYSVLSLGKRLTILPEANGLQVNGAYAFSRHPLYAVYIYWYIVQNLYFQTWTAIILSAIQICLVIIRAKREEKILEKNFPEYLDYKKRVLWFGVNPFINRTIASDR